MLYDEILATPPSIPVSCNQAAIQGEVVAHLRKAARVKADNVAEYLFLTNQKEEWDLAHDFPCPVPPFPVTWIEWVLPRQANTEGKITELHTGGARFGMLLITRDMHEIPPHLGLTDEQKIHAMLQLSSLMNPQMIDKFRALRPEDVHRMPAETRAAFLARFDEIRAEHQGLPTSPEMARWSISAFFVVAQPHMPAPILLPHEIMVTLSGKGDVIPLPPTPEDDESSPFFTIPFSRQEWPMVMKPYLFVPFLTISFLNCKNVRRVDVRPPEKLNKARLRRGKLPLVSYYTLEITPMQEVLRREGKSEEGGLRRALHLCRGFFADYTQGKGLFGKYHGQFWIPQHVRGDAKHGTIKKDYSVNPPRQ